MSPSFSLHVCTTLATINHSIDTILLDCGSSISSISTALVNQLGLPTSTAPSIQVLFELDMLTTKFVALEQENQRLLRDLQDVSTEKAHLLEL